MTSFGNAPNYCGDTISTKTFLFATFFEMIPVLRLFVRILPLAYLGLFYFYPLFIIFRLSFAPNDVIDLSAFAELVTDDYYRRILWFSTWQAAVSTILTLLIALPAAYLFARYHFRGKTLLRTIASVPFVLPALVVASAFSALFGPRSQGLWLMLLAHVFYNYTLVLRIVSGFWANLDPQLTQAAAVLGANGRRTWREITWPLLMPSIGAAALLVFTFCFGAFGSVLLLAGPRYATLEVEIYTQATSFLNLPIAAALSLLQMSATLLLTILYNRVQTRTAALNLRAAHRIQQPVRGWVRWLWLGVITSLALLIVSPLFALVLRAIDAASVLGWETYGALFNQSSSALFGVAPIEAVQNSVLYGLATVILALGVGIPAAYLLNDKTNTRAIFTILDTIFMLPLGTSAVTLGFGYIVAFASPPLAWRAEPWLLPFAHALLALPFVVRTLSPTLRSIDSRLRDAAQVMGASPLQAWREIDWPILARGIAVAAIFAFTISIGEFGATLLLGQPNYPTIPVVIFRFMGLPGIRNYALSLAMGCILMLVTAISFMVIERLRISDSEF